VSSGGFIARFLLGLAGGVAVFTLIVAWSGVRPQGQALAAGQAGGSWASPRELAWLERAGAWETRLMQTIAVRPRDALRACSATLLMQVGAAPTARLQRARDAFRRACAHLAHDEIDAGSAALLEANELLPPGEAPDLPVIAGASGLSRVEPRFGRVASLLAGKDVEARCWSRRDWPQLMREESTYTGGQLGVRTLGFAAINGKRVNLAPDVCDGLARLAYGGLRSQDERDRYTLATAVVTLSHEPQHSKGISREADAECNAIQVAHRAAMSLGATRAYATTLVLAYWTRYDQELPAYRSSECRPGGALDLGYADSIWR
jgi:hypothetical protein